MFSTIIGPHSHINLIANIISPSRIVGLRSCLGFDLEHVDLFLLCGLSSCVCGLALHLYGLSPMHAGVTYPSSFGWHKIKNRKIHISVLSKEPDVNIKQLLKSHIEYKLVLCLLPSKNGIHGKNAVLH